MESGGAIPRREEVWREEGRGKAKRAAAMVEAARESEWREEGEKR